MSPAADPGEKERLRGFALGVLDFLIECAPEARTSLGEMRRIAAGVRTLRDSRCMAREALEMAEGLSAAGLGELDRRLASAGLPTVSAMGGRRHRAFLRILAKDRIVLERDYRLLDEYVANVDAPAITDAHRERAARLIADFHEARSRA